jgi:4-amino-4-deoxy-L-arabinose transferase-like glycosyltransferase
LVAVLNAAAWSLVTPIFQAPDETAHVAYAQYVAERGRPPSGDPGLTAASQEQRRLMRTLGFKQVEFRLDNRPLTTAADRKRIQRLAEWPNERRGEGGYNYATNNPPLYYALEAVVYRASPSSNLTDRIHLMRLFSALLAGLATIFVFLFCRQLLPGSPWAWTLGALAVALLPQFANVAGGLNNDNLLVAASAGCFYLLALGFRRGLDPRLGLALGGLAAIGFLAKINIAGLLPGFALGVGLIVRQAQGTERRTAIRGALAALAAFTLPVLAYMAANTALWDRGLLRGAAESSAPPVSNPAAPEAIPSPEPELLEGVSYVWQFYLPRLPFMDSLLPGYPLADVWLEGFVGRFGLLEFGWPGWVYVLAGVVFIALGCLAGRELWLRRATVRDRAGELLAYAVSMLGLLAIVHWAGYDSRLQNEGGFEQARYLFPLLALYAAVIALAARGAGRRWGPAVGVLIVCLAIAHSLVAVLVALDRYYG